MKQLQKMGFVRTPESMDEVLETIQSLPKDHRYIGALIMYMTWNYCSEVTTVKEKTLVDRYGSEGVQPV